MSQVTDTVQAVTKFLEKALSAWEMFISTRQQAYERKQDKRMRKAIDYAEQIVLNIRASNKTDKELDKLILKFFKYNN